MQIDRSRRFVFLIVLVAVIKIFLSVIIPLTGDEAYFITTGRYPALGYYEHPPMIWWLAYLFSSFGKYLPPVFVYRLFPVFSTILIGIVIFLFLKKYDTEKAFLVSSVFLLSPLNILSVLFVNDIPLVLFVFLSGIFFFYGMENNRIRDFVLSGIFFGLAFLCKYFAVLYLLSVLLFCLVHKKLWKNFLVFILSSLPLIFINIYWNYTHCWINLLFNLVYRNRSLVFDIRNFLLFFVFQIYLMVPWVFYYIIKKGRRFYIFSNSRFLFFPALYIIPVCFLASVSLLRSVGLHWTLAFYPFLFLCLLNLEGSQLKNIFRYTVFFAFAHILLITAVCFLPVTIFKNNDKYSSIVMFKYPLKIADGIKKYQPGYIPAAPGYTESAVMSYYCGEHFVVFGSLSRSGREDDILSDFKEFNNKNFMVFCLEKPDEGFYKQFFGKVKILNINIEGAGFYIVLGEKFRFQNYRDIVLKKVLDVFYTVPEFLPHKGCFLKEKYPGI